MKRTSIAALALAFVFGCGTRKDTSALLARIEFDPNVQATCVEFQVKGTDGTVKVERKEPRGDTDPMLIAVYRGDLPENVVLSAQPLYSVDGKCDGAVKENGLVDEKEGAFPKAGHDEVALTLRPPAATDDHDGDHFAGGAGPDCNDDSADIHPGAVEQCLTGVDYNCNRLAGCDDTSFCSKPACVEPPAAIAFATPTTTAAVGTCVGPVTLQARDSSGSPQKVLGATAAMLSGAPSGVTFYSDAGCATRTTQATIPAGADSASFYFKSNTAGSVTLTAAASGIPSASQAYTLKAGPPTSLFITSQAQTVTAGACSQAVTFQAQDAFGNASAPSATATLNLVASGTGGANVTFYSDASCATAATSVPLAAGGAGSGSFYFKGTQTTAKVTLSLVSSGLGSATQDEAVTPAAPAALVFTTAAQTFSAGACSGVATVESHDVFDNVSPVATLTAVTLSSNPAVLTFYSDASCNISVGSANIAAQGSAASFYFKASAAGPVALTATAAGLTAASQAENITPAAPIALAFTTTAQTRGAGNCSGITTVQTRDGFNTASNVATALTVSLSANPTSGFAFYSDTGCTTPITSVTVPGGGNSASFYFKGTAAGSVAVSASATNFIFAHKTKIVYPILPCDLGLDVWA